MQKDTITITGEYLGWAKIQTWVPSASALIICITNPGGRHQSPAFSTGGTETQQTEEVTHGPWLGFGRAGILAQMCLVPV